MPSRSLFKSLRRAATGANESDSRLMPMSAASLWCFSTMLSKPVRGLSSRASWMALLRQFVTWKEKKAQK